jgi:hypothetical protein
MSAYKNTEKREGYFCKMALVEKYFDQVGIVKKCLFLLDVVC